MADGRREAVIAGSVRIVEKPVPCASPDTGPNPGLRYPGNFFYQYNSLIINDFYRICRA